MVVSSSPPRAAAIAAPALADASKLKPSGWSAAKSSYTNAWTFTGPDALSEAKVIYFEKNDVQDLAEMNARHMAPYGREQVNESGPESFHNGSLIYAGAYVDEGDGTRYMAIGLTAPHKLGGTLNCYMHGPAAPGAG